MHIHTSIISTHYDASSGYQSPTNTCRSQPHNNTSPFGHAFQSSFPRPRNHQSPGARHPISINSIVATPARSLRTTFRRVSSAPQFLPGLRHLLHSPSPQNRTPQIPCAYTALPRLHPCPHDYSQPLLSHAPPSINQCPSLAIDHPPNNNHQTDFQFIHRRSHQPAHTRTNQPLIIQTLNQITSWQIPSNNKHPNLKSSQRNFIRQQLTNLSQDLHQALNPNQNPPTLKPSTQTHRTKNPPPRNKPQTQSKPPKLRPKHTHPTNPIRNKTPSPSPHPTILKSIPL